MSDDKKVESQERRSFMGATAAGVSFAALAAAGYNANSEDSAPFVGAASASSAKNAPKAPFDSMRDWIAALDAHGLLMRFDRIDQDAYQIPAGCFRSSPASPQ